MATATPETETVGKVETELAPLYHVILLDDDDHTYEYVIRMLASVFGFDPAKGMEHATEVDRNGRTILITTTLERAELKQEQVHAFGPDPLMARSAGPMSAVLEPA